MTVTTTLDRQYFPGDGSNKNFPFNFKFFDNSQIYVYLIDHSGLVVGKTLNVDYTLSGALSAGGGQVIMSVAPPINYRLLIQRKLPLTQPTSIRNQGAFFPAIHEDVFDRLTMLVQQAIFDVGNSLQKNQSGTAWDFLGLRGINLADPIDAQDAATRKSVEDYVSSILQTGQGPVNSAQNVLYVFPDMVTRTVQDLSNKSDVLKGAAGLGWRGRNVGSKLDDFVSVKDFGAKGDGGTDDALAINTSLATGAKSVYLPDGIFPISQDVLMQSDQTFFGPGRLKLITKNMNGVVMANKINCHLDVREIFSEIAGDVAYKAGVYISQSSDCSVADGVRFTGMTWAGVMIDNSNRCIVGKIRTKGWLGNIQDSAGVMIYRNSSYNQVRGAYIFGGMDHGVMIQDPYENTNPTGNMITDCFIGEQKCYGISVYIALATTAPYNTRTLISQNNVRDVLGTQLGGASGAGIFIQGAGGTTVSFNTVENCCKLTTNFETLAIAGISAQVGEYPGGMPTPIKLIGNNVVQGRGPCIWASTSSVAIDIDQNTCISYGSEAIRGEAIIVTSVQGGSLMGNTVRHQNPNYNAVRLSAIGADYVGHRLSLNIITMNGSAGGILVGGISSGKFIGFSMNGDAVGGSTAGTAIFLADITKGQISGVSGFSSSAALVVNNCPRIRFVSSSFESSQTVNPAVIFTGSSPDSSFDESNEIVGRTENNASSGVLLSRYADSVPPLGIAAAGDRVIRRFPVVGTSKGWRCTSAPSTWVSEGNL